VPVLPPETYDPIDLDTLSDRPTNSTPFLRSCWVYDTLLGAYHTEQESAWNQIPSMNMRRGMCESEMVENRLYTFGGITTFGITDHSESWAEGDGIWTIEEPIPEPIFGYMSVNDGRYVYIIGGVGLDENDELQIRNTLYRFDTVTKIWIKLPDIPPIDTGTDGVSGGDDYPPPEDDIPGGGGGIGGPFVDPDDDSFGLRYGCAFGNVHLIDGKIHVLCGINLIRSTQFEPVLYNNRVYVYDIALEKWYISSEIIDDDLMLYNRVNAFSFYDEGTGHIHILNGQGYDLLDSGEIDSSNPFTFTDSFRYDPSSIYNLDPYFYSDIDDPYMDPYLVPDNDLQILDLFIPIIRIDDQMYINMPVPRHRGKATTIGLEHYFFGGKIDETQDSPGTVASRKIELVIRDQSNDLFDTDRTLPKGLSGRSFHGMTSDGENKIYIVGGLGTGHAPGYVQIEAGAYGDEVESGEFEPPPCPEDMPPDICEEWQSTTMPVTTLRLDGISGATIRIRAFDDEGDLIQKELTCVVIGYLIFSGEESFGGLMGLAGTNTSEGDRNTLLYPVIFSKNEFQLIQGIGSTRLLPRSEDPLRPIAEMKDILNIDQDYLFAAGSFPYNTIMSINQGEIRSPYEIEIRINIVDDFYYGSTTSTGEDELYGGEGSDGVIYFPEQDQVDIIAGEGEWDLAEFISGFEIKSADGGLPSVIKTSSKIAMIAPQFDSDLFYFNTWDPGEYYLTISRLGFSMLVPILIVYNESMERVFEFEYKEIYGTSGQTESVSLTGSSKYYLLIKALEEEGNPQLDADFGQYRIRVSRAYETSVEDELIPPIDNEVECPFTCPISIEGKEYQNMSYFCADPNVSPSYVDPDYVDPDIIDEYDNFPYSTDEDPDTDDVPNIVLVEPLDFTLIDIDDGLFGGSTLGGGGLSDIHSPKIAFYADFEWLPEVRNILFNNESSYEDLVSHINKLKYTIPFGSSPMMNSIQELSDLLSINDLNKKTIYMLTDNSENTSSIRLSEAIAMINSIGGEGSVPIVIGNISNVYPITLSALSSRTDTEGIDTLSRETRGRSFTILSSSYLDDFVDLAVARGTGAVGFGEMYYVCDLAKLVMINSLSVDFYIPENTDANWSFATSVDGRNYTDFSQEFNFNEIADFSDLATRYIKWHVQFIHLLRSAEDGSVDTPSLTSFNISLSVDKESFIFMNKETSHSSVQQLIATTLSSVPDTSTLEIGVGSGETHDWRDFSSRSQESVVEDGKVFVPIRTTTSELGDPEPLISIDDLVFEAFYGSWDINSNFTVVDNENGQVDVASYRAYPRDGLVIFDSYQRTGSFSIFIDLPSTFRVAIKITNKKSDEQTYLDGIAYQYNTNVFLPSQYTNRPPLAYNLVLLPLFPSVYDTITASYSYADLNGDPEDKEKTEIRWYVNDIELGWLKNVTRFNDLDNPDDPFYGNVGTVNYVLKCLTIDGTCGGGGTPEQQAALNGESIFNIGDSIYFTVKPHDGFQYGDVAQSNVTTIKETPPFLTRLEIRGRRIDTLSFTDVFTTGVQMFADFDWFNPSEQNNSNIRWFVNDEIFKEGILNESNDFNVPNTTLNPGEISAATGVSVHSFDIGNVIYCEIIPIGNSTQGDVVQSQNVTVENEIPSVIDYRITANNDVATINENLNVVYEFVDTDLVFFPTQMDKTIIQWMVSPSEGSSFVEFELPLGSDPSTLYASNTQSGQTWKVRITPFDGVGNGNVVETNEVSIL